MLKRQKMIFDKKYWSVGLFAVLMVFGNLQAGPLANKFDPFCNPSGSGIDPYPALYDEAERGRWNFALDITPYYQDSNSGRNWAGNGQYAVGNTLANVGILEETGGWNIFGIAYGIADEIFLPGQRIPAPATGDATIPENISTKPNDFLPVGSNFTSNDAFATTKLPSIGGEKIKTLLGDGGASWTYKNYQNLINALHAIAFTPSSSSAPSADTHTQGSDGCSYRVTGKPVTEERFSKIFVPDDTAFDDSNYRTETYGFYRPQAQYRRYGVRVKGSITFMPGFKVWAKGGVCDYRVRPIPFAGAEIGVRSEALLEDNRTIDEASQDSGINEELLVQKKKSTRKSSRANKNADISEESRGAQELLDLKRRNETLDLLDQKTDLLNKKTDALSGKISKMSGEIEGHRSMISGINSQEPIRSSVSTSDKSIIDANFLNPISIRQILDELGFAMEPYGELTLEDTYVATDFAYPIIFRGKEGNDVVRCWPTISVGVWLPTSNKKKARHTEQLFRIPVGNDGHTGLSVDGSINLDFLGTITANFGLSATFFDKKTVDKYPIKIHPYQRGIKPWLVKVSRRLGETYAAHASLSAVNFIDGLTAYADYTMVTHRKDEIKISNADLKRLIDGDDLMTDALDDQIRETAWSLQELHVGLAYQVTQNLELGAAFKAHVAGESVPRVKTIMVSMKIDF